MGIVRQQPLDTHYAWRHTCLVGIIIIIRRPWIIYAIF